MKKSLKVFSAVFLGLFIAVNTTSAFAVENKKNIKMEFSDQLIGDDRFETAVRISREGWEKSDTVVVVNGYSIADALSATPLAKLYDSPILLTGKNYLPNTTRNELQRLNAKKVFLIGGLGVTSSRVKSDIRNIGINVERIAGEDRIDTSLKIAKKMEQEKKFTEIFVANGYTGLADALSVAAPAAERSIPIILSSKDSLGKAEKFIHDRFITNSYVIGGNGVISTNVERKIPNVTRMFGKNRNETNSKILKTYYSDKKIKKLFLAKDGKIKLDDLVDGLTIGPLAAKTGSPVMLVSPILCYGQSSYLEDKEVETMYQIGGGISINTVREVGRTLGYDNFPMKEDKDSEVNIIPKPIPEPDIKPEEKPEENKKEENSDLPKIEYKDASGNIDKVDENTLEVKISDGVKHIDFNEIYIINQENDKIKVKDARIDMYENERITLIFNEKDKAFNKTDKSKKLRLIFSKNALTLEDNKNSNEFEVDF